MLNQYSEHNLFKCQTLVDLLIYRANNQSQKNAYIFLEDGETEFIKLTYKDLDRQARAIAVHLQSLTKPGDRALLLYSPGIEFISAFLGCLYASVIAVPAYPPKSNSNFRRLEAILNDAQSTTILTTNSALKEIQNKLAQNFQLANVNWLATDNVTIDLASVWQPPTLTPDTLAFLQYTSGSTGTPKGVMVSHKNLLHNERLIQMAFGHTEKTIFVGWLPLFHDMGLVGNVLQPLYLGIPSILMSPVTFLQKPIRWLTAISRYKGTTSGGPNFAYDLCVRKISPEQCLNLDLRSWEIAFNGAEPIRSQTLEQFTQKFAPYGFSHQAFYPCYGMAETTLFVSGGLKTATPVFKKVNSVALAKNIIESGDDNSPDVQTLVGCGQTFFEKIIIVDPKTRIRCQPDRVGEIWIAGLSVAQGYWNQSDLTKQIFQASLADSNEGLFLRTGDLGFLHEGELYITGRIKDVIIIRGRNYYPQDIEVIVEKSHPALRTNSNAAFSLEIDGEERLIIAQEVDRSYLRKLDVDEVVSAIRKTVSDHCELQVYGVVLLKSSSISKTSSGKIQRYACKAGFLNNSLDVVGYWILQQQGQLQNQFVENGKNVSQASAKEVQQWMINWFSQELKIAPQSIDPKRSFADYGIDSLKAVELAQALGDWLGQNLDMTLAWNFPSIEATAAHLAGLNTPKNNQPIATFDNSNKLVEVSSNLSELSQQELAQLLAQEIALVQKRM